MAYISRMIIDKANRCTKDIRLHVGVKNHWHAVLRFSFSTYWWYQFTQLSSPPNIKRIVWHLLSSPQTGLTPPLVLNHFYETVADGYVPNKFFTVKVACSNLKQGGRPLLSRLSSVKFKTSSELKWAKYEAILELVLVMAVLYQWTLDPSWVKKESRSRYL